MSDELRHRLENAGRDPVTPLRLDVVEKRARRLTLQTLAVAVFSVAAVVAGALAVRSTISTDAAPAPPAEERTQEIEEMNNGRIVQADSGFWPDSTAPPWPGESRSYAWEAFDQDTGSFLFVSLPAGRLVWVVGKDGPFWEFLECPPSASECRLYTFAPAPMR